MVKKTKREWVVYPEVELTVNDIIEHLKMSKEKQSEVVDEIAAEINAEEVTTEEVTTGEELLNLAESEDLTDEQKKEIYIEQLKESKVHYQPTKNKKITLAENIVINKLGFKHKERTTTILTNETVSKFGADYRKKRQTKNKAARKSRRANTN